MAGVGGGGPSIGDDIGPYGLVDDSEEARLLEQERGAAFMEAQHQQQLQLQQGMNGGCQYPFLITNAHKPFAMVKRNPKGDASKADGSFIAANHSFLKLFGYSEVRFFVFIYYSFIFFLMHDYFLFVFISSFFEIILRIIIII